MSQLYARVFCEILDSSIAEDWQARHVFEDFLKLVDPNNGIVDMTREALARRTNIPLDVLNRAIFILESPDPKSRNQDHEGRRLLRLNGHRDWGWVIANFEEYEKIRTRADATERKRASREKGLPPTPSKENTNTYSDTDTEQCDSVTCGHDVSHAVTEKRDIVRKEFDEFWAAYPKKKDKEEAYKAFIRKSKDKEWPGISTLLEAIKKQIFSQEWTRGFIPYPSTWINGKRWTDEVTEAPQTSPKPPQASPQKPESAAARAFALKSKMEGLNSLKASIEAEGYHGPFGLELPDKDSKKRFRAVMAEIRDTERQLAMLKV